MIHSILPFNKTQFEKMTWHISQVHIFFSSSLQIKDEVGQKGKGCTKNQIQGAEDFFRRGKRNEKGKTPGQFLIQVCFYFCSSTGTLLSSSRREIPQGESHILFPYREEKFQTIKRLGRDLYISDIYIPERRRRRRRLAKLSANRLMQ